jgi:hypothetical protein
VHVCMCVCMCVCVYVCIYTYPDPDPENPEPESRPEARSRPGRMASPGRLQRISRTILRVIPGQRWPRHKKRGAEAPLVGYKPFIYYSYHHFPERNPSFS